MGFFDESNRCIYATNTKLDDVKMDDNLTKGKVIFDIPSLPLMSGKYSVNASIVDNNGTLDDLKAQIESWYKLHHE